VKSSQNFKDLNIYNGKKVEERAKLPKGSCSSKKRRGVDLSGIHK